MENKDDTRKLSGLAKRFLMVMDMTGYTDYRLEKETGIISQAVVADIMSGKREPSMEIVRALLKKLPSINGHWLLTGVGQRTLEIYPDDEYEDFSYEDILCEIPVDEIISHIYNNETMRGFHESEIYNLFIELWTQRKVTERMLEVEAKLDEILEQKKKDKDKD